MKEEPTLFVDLIILALETSKITNPLGINIIIKNNFYSSVLSFYLSRISKPKLNFVYNIFYEDLSPTKHIYNMEFLKTDLKKIEEIINILKKENYYSFVILKLNEIIIKTI